MDKQTFEIVPGVRVEIDPEKFRVEGGFTLNLPGTDYKVLLDVRIVDVLNQQTSKIENILSLRSA